MRSVLCFSDLGDLDGTEGAYRDEVGWRMGLRVQIGRRGDVDGTEGADRDEVGT